MIGKPLFYTGAFCAVVVAAMLVATRSVTTAVRYEVARVRSPDLSQDAVLVEIPRGPPVRFNYTVYLERAGRNRQSGIDKETHSRPVAFLFGSRRSKCAFGASLRWLDSAHLSIEYMSALSAHVPANEHASSVIVSLMPGRADAGAENIGVPCPEPPVAPGTRN